MLEPFGEIQVADSRFLGFCFDNIHSADDALSCQAQLRSQFSEAAHIPVVWKLSDGSQGFDEDDEPPQSVGPGVLKQWSTGAGVAVVIVRYFQSQLLGVTCGRLPQCYQSIARLALHRFSNGKTTSMEWEITTRARSNIYGMAAGDCELILNVVKEPADGWLQHIQDELNFDGFRGAAGEVLPRLQNLQADLSDKLIPVYRYPGNYNGQEWDTFDWGPRSLQIKTAVEEALKPLVHQTMNHCVANYYRDGKDFIAHHSDKDLDLNRDGVIVSVSLGDERIFELRRRQEPKDVIRVALPHGSMLVLGPKTNAQFSHSILPKDESTKPRISLTLREVKTFLDLTTGRLFGQGVQAKSLSEVRSRDMLESVGCFGGFCGLSAWLVRSSSSSRKNSQQGKQFVWQSSILVGLLATGALSFRYWKLWRYQQKEEKAARHFFSKASMSGTKY